MAFLGKWKHTVEKLTHPVAQEERTKEIVEDESSIYIKAFFECLTELERKLHVIKEPKEIGLSALVAACEFYDADWCGVLDVDIKLKLWMPFWWYNRKTGGMTATKSGRSPMPMIIKALYSSPDTERTKMTSYHSQADCILAGFILTLSTSFEVAVLLDQEV